VSLVAVSAAIIAAFLHVWIFALESVWFLRPAVWRRFRIATAADAEVVRPFAFNQGFYNLFLAIGVAIGLGLVGAGHVEAGRAIVFFACGSMIAAGSVLVAYNPAMIRAAALQIVPALIVVVALGLA
jgi:putative membrane protein